MVLYRVIAPAWLNLRRLKPGDTVEWDGPPSRALVPIEPEPVAEVPPQEPEPKRRGRPPKVK